MTEASEAAAHKIRKAKGEGYQRRAEILLAAEGIFVAVGYKATTVRGIAKAVGISSAGLYVHFPDKEAILLEICLQALTGLEASLSEIAAHPTEPKDTTRRILHAFCHFGLTNRAAHQAVFGTERIAMIESKEDVMLLAWDCVSYLINAVLALSAAGLLNGKDPMVVVQALGVSCHGLVSLLNMAPALPWIPQDVLIDAVIDGLFNGLVTDPA